MFHSSPPSAIPHPTNGPSAGGVPLRACAAAQPRGGAAPGGPSWYRGKKPAAVEVIDETTGQVVALDPRTGRELKPRDRSDKYRLQTHAGYLLKDVRTPKGGGYAVGRCNRFLGGLDDQVTIRKGETGSYFSGLVQCGSVWHCPVCAAKIAERRREQLELAVTTCQDQGGSNAMLTLTFPHTRADELDATLKLFVKALAKFRESRAYKAACKRVGLVGHVRALEVTWGAENGWHPHCHELLFFPSPVLPGALLELKAALLVAWKAACALVGLPEPDDKHGLDVRDALSAGAYLSKFGIERKWGPGAELARSHVKVGRGQRFTPWDLLAESYDARMIRKEADRFGHLWLEYAKAFHARRQLHWSKGLKALYAVPDLTDEELVQAEEKGTEETVTVIDFRTWRELFAVAKVDRRGQLLDLADRGGSAVVDAFIRDLRLEAKFGEFWRDHLKWEGPELLRYSLNAASRRPS